MDLDRQLSVFTEKQQKEESSVWLLPPRSEPTPHTHLVSSCVALQLLFFFPLRLTQFRKPVCNHALWALATHEPVTAIKNCAVLHQQERIGTRITLRETTWKACEWWVDYHRSRAGNPRLSRIGDIFCWKTCFQGRSLGWSRRLQYQRSVEQEVLSLWPLWWVTSSSISQLNMGYFPPFCSRTTTSYCLLLDL